MDRAERVDLEVGHRVGKAGRHRDLRREVDDRAGVVDQMVDHIGVADVGDFGGDPLRVALPQPGEVVLDAGARERIDDQNVLPFAREAFGKDCSRESPRRR